MKTITIEYIQHLASFLDEAGIKWEAGRVGGTNDTITIYYNTEHQLFRIAFEFGKFYNSIDNTEA
jgi:hypothetical protein